MKTAITLVLFATSLPTFLSAGELAVRWNEIPHSLVTGRKAEVRLTGNTTLHGTVVSVTLEGLRMEITKVRGQGGNYKQGESIVPADQIAAIKVDRAGTRGRIIGTAIGGGIGVAVVAGAAAVASNEGYDYSAGAVAAGLLAPAAVGYLVGWARDRNVTTIRVVR